MVPGQRCQRSWTIRKMSGQGDGQSGGRGYRASVSQTLLTLECDYKGCSHEVKLKLLKMLFLN